MNPLYLRQLLVGPMENFIYLIGDKNTKECVMVDPAWDVAAVLKVAEKDGMKVTGALATHYHNDHTNGISDLLNRFGVRTYIHKDDAPYLKGLQSELTKVESGHKLKVGDVEITFIHTPGHTPGSQCFLVNNNLPQPLSKKSGKAGTASDADPFDFSKMGHQMLVSGDTLFIGACGRCDLPGGDPEQMYYSLQRLAKLGDDVILFPGHNYAQEPTSTIGQEKQLNPYYQAASLQDFLSERMG